MLNKASSYRMVALMKDDCLRRKESTQLEYMGITINNGLILGLAMSVQKWGNHGLLCVVHAVSVSKWLQDYVLSGWTSHWCEFWFLCTMIHSSSDLYFLWLAKWLGTNEGASWATHRWVALLWQKNRFIWTGEAVIFFKETPYIHNRFKIWSTLQGIHFILCKDRNLYSSIEKCRPRDVY